MMMTKLERVELEIRRLDLEAQKDPMLQIFLSQLANALVPNCPEMHEYPTIWALGKRIQEILKE
jgi:hypothetical protein